MTRLGPLTSKTSNRNLYKRLLALLLSALLAASCMLLTACGGGGDTTDDPADTPPSDSQPGDTADPGDDPDPSPSSGSVVDDPSDTSSGGDRSSGSLDPIPTPLDEFEGEEKMAELYSAGFECWNGYWQACVTINKDELDATENVGTEDYAYEWHVAARVADSSDEWMKVQAQLDTLYDFDVNAADANVIYRLQLGTWTTNLVVDTEYEFVIQTKKNGEWLTKSLVYVTWTQDYVDQYNYWVTGVDKDGNAIERKVPTIPPVEGVDFA